jgi:beta-lactamase class A
LARKAAEAYARRVLADRLAELADEKAYLCAWVLEDLRGDGRWAHDEDAVVPASSTRKVAIMAAVLEAVERGELDLAQTVPVTPRGPDRIFTGTLQHLTPGLALSLRDVVTLMIVWSDNLCTAELVDLVGLAAVNDLCGRVGMASTVHRHALIPKLAPDHPLEATTVTTAADQARLYRTLLAAAAGAETPLQCRAELCAVAFEILCAQQHRTMIPSLLPVTTTVANKPGMGWRDISDGGVVYAGGEPLYLLVAYADRLPPTTDDGLPGYADARQLIATMSRACWDAFA